MILAIAAFAVAAIGAGEWSIDHALGLDVDELVGRRHRRRSAASVAVCCTWPAFWRPPRAADMSDAGDAPRRRAGHRDRRRVDRRRWRSAWSSSASPPCGSTCSFFAPQGTPTASPTGRGRRAERAVRGHRRGRRGAAGGPTFADIEPKAEALRQRADVVDQATVIARPTGRGAAGRPRRPTTDEPRRSSPLWLADWDGYLQDRRDQAERLRRARTTRSWSPRAGRCARSRRGWTPSPRPTACPAAGPGRHRLSRRRRRDRPGCSGRSLRPSPRRRRSGGWDGPASRRRRRGRAGRRSPPSRPPRRRGGRCVAPGSTTVPWPSHEPSPMRTGRSGCDWRRDRQRRGPRSRGSGR